MTATTSLADELRASDKDRYLSTLYAPAEMRPALTALYAFNVEIASVRDRIRDPLPGEMRLQWWRDVLEAGTPEAAEGHPLATALIETIRQQGLPPKPFIDMLDARVFDLYDDPMPSRGDLEGYLGETASALIQLSALVLDAKAARAVAELAGHAGCAQGIAGLLRLLPLHRARGQCYLPNDVLTAAGTDAATMIAGSDRAAARRAIDAMVALGRDHWLAFQRGAGILPASLRPAFLAAGLAPYYLDAIAKTGDGALREPVDIAQWRKQWTMFRAGSRGW